MINHPWSQDGIVSTGTKSLILAFGRNPISSATPTTSVVETTLRTSVAVTCPVSTAELAMSMDRNRSIRDQ